MKNRLSSHLLLLLGLAVFEIVGYAAIHRAALIRGYETSLIGAARDLLMYFPIIVAALWISELGYLKIHPFRPRRKRMLKIYFSRFLCDRALLLAGKENARARFQNRRTLGSDDADLRRQTGGLRAREQRRADRVRARLRERCSAQDHARRRSRCVAHGAATQRD